MTTNKYKETVEAYLFRAFSGTMLADIYQSGLFDQSERTLDHLKRFAAYYDPARNDYVTRVETWQIAMCQQTVPGDWDRLCSWPTGLLEDLGVLERDRHYDWTLRNADPFALKALHQLVRAFFKFEGKPRSETNFETVKFRLSHPTTVIDHDGSSHDALNLSSQEVAEMRNYLKFLIAPRSWNDLRGRYGPGASSDAKSNKAKFMYAPLFVSAPQTLELYHLVRDNTIFNDGDLRRSFYRYGITKIAEVPKSLKSNRIVSSEPANSMFAQLAIEDELSTMLNRIYDDSVSLDDTDKHIRLLFMKGYTSIDLSDASDHVSRRLVSLVMPHWKQFLFSVRSTFARFPDGSLCPLRTFAPMGAGHCFGVLTAIVLAICGSVARRPFHVYGDDIICHVTDYHSIIDRLTRSGLVVNAQKSCPTGIYRESCGTELYYTTRVTPLYLRREPAKVDMYTLEAWLTRLEEGWVAPFWVHFTERLIRVWLSANPSVRVRWSRKYQQWEILGPVWVTRACESRIDGDDALRRWLTTATDDRNERPDTQESWVSPTKPRLFTWQQAIYGRTERYDYNIAGHIAERRGSNTVLNLKWKSACELPRLLTAVLKEIEDCRDPSDNREIGPRAVI